MGPQTAKRLMIFFGLAYFAQGLAGGLITQPLTYYLKSLGLGTSHAAQFAALIAVPWMIKPLYGLMTDFVPLFGRRRKIYLVLMPAMALTGYSCLMIVQAPPLIAAALMLTTEALVSELPEEKKEAPMPGGHGGMGGMY